MLFVTATSVLILFVFAEGRGQRSESLRLPQSSDSCNVVNLNFGGGDEPRERGPQGPSGKRGIPGIQGLKGERGEKGDTGSRGPSPEINVQDVTASLFKALGAFDCEELMKVHGLSETGYYLLRTNDSRHPVYTYCNFEIRRVLTGKGVCQRVREEMEQGMESGYYLTKYNDSAEPNFVYCSKNAPKDCTGVNRDDSKRLNSTGGVFDIYPANDSVEVYCDLETDGGGWIVFQRRMDGSVDFHRNWNEYVNGFGERDKEFWLGLETIHQLTKEGSYELRIDLNDWEGRTAYAKYGTFSIAGASEKYRLMVSGYQGNAGDSMSWHTNMKFSTVDQDNDKDSANCAKLHKGGWWFNACDHSNLNGLYRHGGSYSASYDDGVEWHRWRSWYSMKSTEMKFRPAL